LLGEKENNSREKKTGVVRAKWEGVDLPAYREFEDRYPSRVTIKREGTPKAMGGHIHSKEGGIKSPFMWCGKKMQNMDHPLLHPPSKEGGSRLGVGGGVRFGKTRVTSELLNHVIGGKGDIRR